MKNVENAQGDLLATMSCSESTQQGNEIIFNKGIPQKK